MCVFFGTASTSPENRTFFCSVFPRVVLQPGTILCPADLALLFRGVPGRSGVVVPRDSIPSLHGIPSLPSQGWKRGRCFFALRLSRVVLQPGRFRGVGKNTAGGGKSGRFRGDGKKHGWCFQPERFQRGRDKRARAFFSPPGPPCFFMQKGRAGWVGPRVQKRLVAG